MLPNLLSAANMLYVSLNASKLLFVSSLCCTRKFLPRKFLFIDGNLMPKVYRYLNFSKFMSSCIVCALTKAAIKSSLFLNRIVGFDITMFSTLSNNGLKVILGSVTSLTFSANPNCSILSVMIKSLSNTFVVLAVVGTLSSVDLVSAPLRLLISVTNSLKT